VVDKASLPAFVLCGGQGVVDNFCMVQAKRDIKRVNGQGRDEAREWREARERLEGELREANGKVARLEGEIDELKKEAERSVPVLGQ
jgi:predicted  nucleic acid-binding Zn-ribbon protein